MLHPDSRVTLAPAAIFHSVGEEGVALNNDTGRYYGLDPVATRMLTLLLQERAPSAVLPLLQQEYEVAPDELAQDLAALITQLEAAGIVRVEQV